MKQQLISELQYLMTFKNRFGDDITPMFPVPESELATWVENMLAEGKFIKFKRL